MSVSEPNSLVNQKATLRATPRAARINAPDGRQKRDFPVWKSVPCAPCERRSRTAAAGAPSKAPGMLRTFIAVKITPTPELRRLHALLAGLDDRMRPVPLNNLHVTLKFLGDTHERQLAEIGAFIQEAARDRPAFDVRLVGLGAFPNERRPAVVWVGLESAETLGVIAAELDRRLELLGFAPEGRPFQPHLTLLRVKFRPVEQLFALLAAEARTDFGATRIDKVELFQSELKPGGPQYTSLAACALARAP